MLGEARNRALRHFSGLEPIIVYAHEARLGLERQDRLEREHPFEQRGELVLPDRRHQEVPECSKTAPLIRIADRVPIAENLFQELSLSAFPQRDPLPDRSVELAEVLLHLAEVRQQRARGGCHLDKAVLDLCVVHQRHVSALDPSDLALDLRLAFFQLGEARVPIPLGALDDLPQQLEHGQQPGFRRHELPLAQAGQPVDRLLGGGRQIEVRLIAVGRVVLA